MAFSSFASAQNPVGAGGPLPGAPITAQPAPLPPLPPQAVPVPLTRPAAAPNAAAPNAAAPNAAAPNAAAPAAALPVAPTPPPPANPAPPPPAADRVYRPVLDKTKGFVGDVFTYTLQIAHEPTERLLIPAEPNFAPFELRGRDFFKRTLDDGKVEETFVFRIAVYKVGTHRTPSIEIPFVTKDGRTLRTVTQDVDIVIETLLPAGTQLPPLKDIKPPIQVIVRDWRLLWAGGILAALLLAALIAWAAIRYGKRLAARPRAAPPPPPPRPAHLIAYEKLARVRLPTTEVEQQLFYDLVSNIAREYYGNRYGFLALDMTTAEILKVLRPLDAPGLTIDEVRRFLADADLVKFAKFVPDGEEPHRYLGEARRLVDVTRALDDAPSVSPPTADVAKKAA